MGKYIIGFGTEIGEIKIVILVILTNRDWFFIIYGYGGIYGSKNFTEFLFSMKST